MDHAPIKQAWPARLGALAMNSSWRVTYQMKIGLPHRILLWNQFAKLPSSSLHCIVIFASKHETGSLCFDIHLEMGQGP